jgi:hypothetical protein
MLAGLTPTDPMMETRASARQFEPRTRKLPTTPKKSKKVKTSPRKTPAPKPKAGKSEGDWKDVIKKQ